MSRGTATLAAKRALGAAPRPVALRVVLEESVEHLAHRGGLAHRAAVGADAVGRDDAHHLTRLVRDDEARRDLG